MFCALVAIIVLFVILIGGVTISAIDIESYNFGLYYALLAIVGIMIACAICIVKPPSIKNPIWYDRCCRRMADYFAPDSRKNSRQSSGNRDRQTLVMLGPALELMHHVLHGMTSQGDSDDRMSVVFDMSGDTSDTTSNDTAHYGQRLKVPETIDEEPTIINSIGSNV